MAKVKIKVSELNTGDFLSDTVYANSFQPLLYEGTRIKQEDIEFLIKNGIKEVCIFEDVSKKINNKEKEVITKEVHNDCAVKVKKILNTYVCSSDANLKELTNTANDIVDGVFKCEDVAVRIYDIKQRSGDLYDHAVSLSSLSILTALKFNLNHEEVCDIGVGSLLHDLGLKFLSIDYLDRDISKFTPDEMFEYKKHTLYGFSSVEDERWMATISKRIVLQHHERLDGSGFPFKLKSISTPVKIVSVCDGFLDRISGIGCKKMKVDEALLDIEKYRDIYYDGKVVDIFEAFIAMYPVGTNVLTAKGEEAVVLEQTEYFTDRPVIKITKDVKGQPVTRNRIINLSENRYESIVKSL